MIKTLRIKVALELDSGNGEELSKFSSEFKKKKREKSLLSVKMTIFFFERIWLESTFLRKKASQGNNTYLINFPYVL